MGNVYSIRTGKKLEQNTTDNDALVAQGGRYIGCLPKADAEELRKFQQKLIVDQMEIDELIKKFEGSFLLYLNDVASVFMYLGIDPQTFDPNKEHLYIGADGHLWVVPFEKERENTDESGI